jgi:hypothetical protein
MGTYRPQSQRLRRRTARPSLASEPYLAGASEPAKLHEILITEKLRSRRRRKPNAYAENAALRGLARVMATSPNQLVDTLLRAALELCSAGTAGLSLLETPPGCDAIFRWTNLAGSLSKHIRRTTPRNFSPCGVTLDQRSPQLFAHPDRRFQYFRGLDFPIVEALVIPVELGGEIPGTIWVVSHDDEVKFDSEDVRIMTGLAEFTSCALRMTRISAVHESARLVGDETITAHEITERALRVTQASMEIDIAARAAQLEQLSAKLLTVQDEERRRLGNTLPGFK